MVHIRTFRFIFLCLCFFISLLSCAHEFLYPVAHIELNGETKLYVLYQKSVTHLELWLWDPDTKLATKGLLSTYTPASLRVLPSGDGFSFIDDGRVRIKKFHRRSPKAIDMYEPIYGLSELHWIDENSFYVSAKKNGCFCVFHITHHGIIKPILEDKDYDFMYPQKVGDTLFYIERLVKQGECKREHVSYKLVKTAYPGLAFDIEDFINSQNNPDNQAYNFDEQVEKIKQLTAPYIENIESEEQKKEYIVDFKASPIAFLHMISETEGFFLEHPDEIDRHDEAVMFKCFYIKQRVAEKERKWDCKHIFSFSIPSYLILDLLDFCLYESMLPLLPRYYNGKIYYVDSSPVKAKNLTLFAYDLQSETFEQKSFAKAQQLLFSPIFSQKTIFYGGKIESSPDFGGNFPKMWINDQGEVCIDLPSCSIA